MFTHKRRIAPRSQAGQGNNWLEQKIWFNQKLLLTWALGPVSKVRFFWKSLVILRWNILGKTDEIYIWQTLVRLPPYFHNTGGEEKEKYFNTKVTIGLCD